MNILDYQRTDTLENHIEYTRVEFFNSPYYLAVLDFLKDNKIKSSLDLGGCAGETTMILLENIPTIERAFIVEPIQESYNFIRQRVPQKCITINKALFYGSDFVKIGNNRGSVGSYSIDFANDDSISYEATTLEDLYQSIGDVDFIKIDIEGCERNVIENSTYLQTIQFIEIEFHRELMVSTNWVPYVNRFFPNHTILYGGQDGRGQDGSAFLIKNNK